MRYAFEAELWTVDGPGGWCFLTLPADVSEGLRALGGGKMRPFGSLAVVATVGGSTWRTSLFADRKRGAFLLPVKAAVRAKERIAAGDRVAAAVELDL